MHALAGDDIPQFAASALPAVADMHLVMLQDEVEATVAAYRKVTKEAATRAREFKSAQAHFLLVDQQP